MTVWTPRRVTAGLAVPAEVSGRRLLVDRGGLVVAAGFYLLVSFAISGLWSSAAREQGTLAGYTPDALVWYAFMAEAAVCAIEVRLIERIGEDIADGAYTVETVRPLPALAVRFAVEAGRALASLAVLATLGGAVAWLVAGPPPSAVGALLAIPALVLAVLVSLALQHLVAASSFWLRDAKVGWFLYLKGVFLLGGLLLPLEVLPGAMRDVAYATPFLATAYAPARLAAGVPGWWPLAVQAGWLVVTLAAAAAAFAAGQRRTQVTG